MDIITRFDPANAQKAHNDTILAGPVLPTGLFSPFDHAWGYLNGPGAMEPHSHHRKRFTFSQRGTAMSSWMESATQSALEM